jgi:Allene oxide cyclase barrel like domain
MKRKIAVCIAIPGLIAAIALAVTANGQSREGKITLHARSQLEHAHVVDNAPSGHSVGDVLIFTERLLDSNDHVIGHDAASCTFLFGKRSLCTGGYFLPDGQITVQLRQPGLGGTVTYTQAITGGTRRYAGATGTVTVDQQPSGDRFTFNIQLPS